MSDIAPSTAANGSWRFKRDTKCEEISPQYLRALLALTAKAQREHYERIPMGPETAPLMNNCSQRLRQTLEWIFICSWFTAFIEEEIQKLRNFQVAHGSVIGVCLTKLFVMCTVSRWVACPIGFMEEFAVVLRFKQIFSFITDRY
uniref:Uncharacterized protein n=1 Tax=Trichuris muris TaxID=70415 RepID=A0A5S6QWI7_TRIMR